MSRRVLNPVLPGGVLSPISGADELTAAEEIWVQNGSAGTYGNVTPTGATNDSNVTFTLPVAPSPASSLKLFKNGQLLTAGGVDYTLSVLTITMIDPPLTGDVLRAWFEVNA